MGHVYWASWGAGTLFGAAVLSPGLSCPVSNLSAAVKAVLFTAQAVASDGLQTQVCCFVVFQCFLFQVIVTFSC